MGVGVCVQSIESPPQPSTSQGTERSSGLIDALPTPFSPSGVPPQMCLGGSAMSQGGSVYSAGSGTPWDELESDSPTRGHRHAAQVRVSQTPRTRAKFPRPTRWKACDAQHTGLCLPPHGSGVKWAVLSPTRGWVVAGST